LKGSRRLVKILRLGLKNSVGGVEKIIYSFIERIDRQKIHFGIVAAYDGVYLREGFEAMGSAVYDLPDPNVHPFFHACKLIRLINNEHYDIVHINMVTAANSIQVFAARMSKCRRVIVHSHNSRVQSGIIRNILHFWGKLFISCLATDFFACSKEAARHLFYRHDFVMVRNAIDVKRFLYNDMARVYIRNKLKLTEDTMVVGNVGRFEIQKNHLFLLDIFSKLLLLNPRAVLLLVGEGSLENRIREKAAKSGIEKNIIFYGTAENVQDIYSAMDILVMPSLYEGLSIVGVEAQASGLPIIASDVISREMAITDSVAFLGLSENPSLWADMILKNSGRKYKEDIIRIVSEKGYDISVESKLLESRYFRLMGKSCKS
jgi:glycosyltransferase involved in cell wall biosynthesis